MYGFFCVCVCVFFCGGEIGMKGGRDKGGTVNSGWNEGEGVNEGVKSKNVVVVKWGLWEGVRREAEE